MKKFCLLLCLMAVWGSFTVAQQPISPDSANLSLFSLAVDSSGNILDKYLFRKLMLWGPKLGATGNPRETSTAYSEYVKQFVYPTTGSNKYFWNGEIPQWEEKGPVGKVNQNFLGADGIGRINRLAFDPNYDFVNNLTLYAASEAGGLWRTEDDGLNWHICGTDQIDFPTSAIADMIVHPTNSDVIYVATGNCDKRPNISYTQDEYYRYTVFNHQFTMGIWKGVLTVNRDPTTSNVIDIDVAWTPINVIDTASTPDTTSFLSILDLAGDGTEVAFATIENIEIREEPNPPVGATPKIEMWVATSKGVLRNLDVENNGDWEMVLGIPNGFKNATFRGIVFKENDPNTIYVSGRNIHRSTDGGNSWHIISTDSLGLDFDSIASGGTAANVVRINLKSIPSQTGQPKLWAYILSEKPFERFVYVFDDTQTPNWSKVASGIGGNPDEDNGHFITSNRSDFAINPEAPNEIFACGNNVLKVTGTNFTEVSSYRDKTVNGVKINNVHPDIHALAFPPKTDSNYTFKLFCGHDGGISVTTVSNPEEEDWVPRSHGLGVARMWGFDDGVFSEEKFIMALQDITMKYKPDVQSDWGKIVGFGEGFAAQIDERQDEDILFSFGHDVTYYTFNGTTEGIKAPFEPYTEGKPLFKGMMKLINHPRTAVAHLTGYELFRLEGRLFAPDTSHVWKIITDKGWQKGDSATNQYGFSYIQRLSNAAAFCPSAPEELMVARDPWVIYDFNGPLSLTNPYAIINNPDWPSVLFRSLSPGGCDLPGEGGDPNDRGKEVCVEDITQNLISSIQAVSPAISLREIEIFGDTNDIRPTLPTITGIVFDPKDSDRVWVSFSGYRNQLKVWHSGDRGDTWQNWDPMGDLDNLPVNDITYQRGTDDRLIIATDRGVYMKEGVGAWERYGEGLPNVLTMSVHINYCAGKVRVGTWGRGAWETDLYPFSEPFDEYVISSTDPWVYDVSPGVTNEIEAEKRISMDRNIRIKSGVTFTIKGELSMPADGRIIVESGAKLHVDGGTITNFCGETWYGIFAGGYDTLSQQDPAGGMPGDHAWVLIENEATIEYARDGVHNYDEVEPGSGGIIQAINSTFHNNRRSIAMVQYNAPNGSPDYSYFQNCTFEIDSEFREYDPFMAHVTMWDIKDIQFDACNFIFDTTISVHPSWVNTNSQVYHDVRGAGIYGIDASFHVTGASHFEGLTHGVYSASTGSNLKTFSIIGCDFEDNIYGVIADGVNLAEISHNTFNVGGNLASENPGNQPPGEFVHKGIVMNSCTGYEIKHNDMVAIAPGSDEDTEPYSTGVEINSSGANPNLVYNNSFLSFIYANRANCENRDAGGGIGLEYLCNENASNYFDFFIDDDVSGCGDQFDPSLFGVKQEQGDGSSSASNTFSIVPNPLTSPYGQSITNLPFNADMEYFFDSQPNKEPKDVNSNPIFNLTPASARNCNPGQSGESITTVNDLIIEYEEMEQVLLKEVKTLNEISAIDTVLHYSQQRKVNTLRQRLYINGYAIIRQLLHENRPMGEVRSWISKLNIAAKPLLLALSWQTEAPEQAEVYWQQVGIYPSKIIHDSIPDDLQSRLSAVKTDQKSAWDRAIWTLHTSEILPSHTPYSEQLKTTGIDRKTPPSDKLNIQPNPATHICSVSWGSARERLEVEVLKIFDSNGRVLQIITLSPNDQKVDMDISTFSPGIYLIQVKGKFKTWSEKLVVAN